jgi:hypothetical protein
MTLLIVSNGTSHNDLNILTPHTSKVRHRSGVCSPPGLGWVKKARLRSTLFIVPVGKISLQLASVAFVFVHLILLRKRKQRERRWRWTELYRTRPIHSGTRLLADLSSKFTPVAPADFELLINLVGAKIMTRHTRFRATIPIQERVAVTLRFLATGDSYTTLQYISEISKQTARLHPKCVKPLLRRWTKTYR